MKKITKEDDHHEATIFLESLASGGSTDTVDYTLNFSDGNNLKYMSDTSDEDSGQDDDADSEHQETQADCSSGLFGEQGDNPHQAPTTTTGEKLHQQRYMYSWAEITKMEGGGVFV